MNLKDKNVQMSKKKIKKSFLDYIYDGESEFIYLFIGSGRIASFIKCGESFIKCGNMFSEISFRKYIFGNIFSEIYFRKFIFGNLFSEIFFRKFFFGNL